MSREDVVRQLISLRKARDASRREAADWSETYSRGMAAGFHLAAIWLWRTWRDTK